MLFRSCLGAAMLAGMAAGIYRDEEDAVRNAVHIREQVTPDPVLAETYGEVYRTYREIYPALEPVRAGKGSL